jgi:hypothetical protein
VEHTLHGRHSPPEASRPVTGRKALDRHCILRRSIVWRRHSLPVASLVTALHRRCILHWSRIVRRHYSLPRTARPLTWRNTIQHSIMRRSIMLRSITRRRHSLPKAPRLYT